MSETIVSPFICGEGAEAADEGSLTAVGSYVDWGDRPAIEVTEKLQQRGFDKAFTLPNFAEANRCNGHGKLGELLRREGCCSSHLSTWRAQPD